MKLSRLDMAVGTPCPYCGVSMDWRGFGGASVSREHVYPRSRGGALTIIACEGCNIAKGAMMPFDWIEYLYAIGRRDDAVRTIRAYCKLGRVFAPKTDWREVVAACDALCEQREAA